MSITPQLIRNQTDRYRRAGNQARRTIREQLRLVEPRKTGRLSRSLRTRQDDTGTDISITVTYTARHADWVAFGTQPHSIKPRKKKALKFEGPERGYAASAFHPGSRPNPWMDKVVTNANWRSVMNEALARTR